MFVRRSRTHPRVRSSCAGRTDAASGQPHRRRRVRDEAAGRNPRKPTCSCGAAALTREFGPAVLVERTRPPANRIAGGECGTKQPVEIRGNLHVRAAQPHSPESSVQLCWSNGRGLRPTASPRRVRDEAAGRNPRKPTCSCGAAALTREFGPAVLVERTRPPANRIAEGECGTKQPVEIRGNRHVRSPQANSPQPVVRSRGCRCRRPCGQ